MDPYDGMWCGGPQGCGLVIPKGHWNSHQALVHGKAHPDATMSRTFVELTEAVTLERDHELGLVLNVLVDLDQCLDITSLTPEQWDRVQDILVEHTGLCPPKHIGDSHHCIVPGCPVFERESREALNRAMTYVEKGK